MESKAVLECIGLSKHYEKKPAVQNVSLVVPLVRMVDLLESNGSRKLLCA